MSLIIDDYTVPAGAELPLMFSGKFFMLMESTYPVNIYVIKNRSRVGKALNVRQGVRQPISIGFDGIIIESVNGLAQPVKVAISDDATDYALLTGDVSVNGNVTTQDYIVALGENHYHAAVQQVGSVSNYAHAQLWNPAGSGKRLTVYSARIGAPAGNPFLGFYNTALSALAPNTPENAYSGKAASVAQMRVALNLAVLPANFFSIDQGASLATLAEQLSTPVIIEPGQGLCAYNNQTNQVVNMNVRFLQETI